MLCDNRAGTGFDGRGTVTIGVSCGPLSGRDVEAVDCISGLARAELPLGRSQFEQRLDRRGLQTQGRFNSLPQCDEVGYLSQVCAGVSSLRIQRHGLLICFQCVLWTILLLAQVAQQIADLGRMALTFP